MTSSNFDDDRLLVLRIDKRVEITFLIDINYSCSKVTPLIKGAICGTVSYQFECIVYVIAFTDLITEQQTFL